MRRVLANGARFDAKSPKSEIRIPQGVAYNIVKTMFEKKDRMVKVHKESQNFKFRYQTNAANRHSVLPRRREVFLGKRGRQITAGFLHT